MEKIIVVEEDPIIALDLFDLLRSHFDSALVEQLTLPNALAALTAGGSGLVTLVTERLPEVLSAETRAALAQVKVIVTNFPDEKVRALLPSASFIERPFEPSKIAAIIKGHS